MIDIRFLREDPERVKENCRRRGITTVDIDELCHLDNSYLHMLKELEQLQEKRNSLSKDCQMNPDLRHDVKELKIRIKEKQQQLSTIKKQIHSRLSWIPNFLSDKVPEGKDDVDNVEIRRWGKIPIFAFPAQDHQALGETLQIIDTQRGAKVAKAGFYFWKGKGAQLCNALFFWAQQTLIQRGFTLFLSPCVAKEASLFGTGYQPFLADQTYQLSDEDLSLIGTSEQTLVAYHADEILYQDSLPCCYTAFSPCFRTEAGSYGKASRGIFRVHQFHKVEQIVFCLPEESEHYHQFCQEQEEYLLQQLGIPYRVVNVCIGDLGAPGYQKYDIEAAFPGYGNYREVTSNTNLTDFQARRLNIRYQDKAGKKGFVHTISATAVTDRLACAILENFQEQDGSVRIPKVLQIYTNFDRIPLP